MVLNNMRNVQAGDFVGSHYLEVKEGGKVYAPPAQRELPPPTNSLRETHG